MRPLAKSTLRFWLARAGRVSALAACLMSAAAPVATRASEPAVPFATATEQPDEAFELSGELAKAICGLTHADAAIRKNALERISWMAADAEPAIVDVTLCLTDPEPEIRAYAAKTLWDVDKQSTLAAVNTLRDLVDSTQPGIRPLAAFYLGYIGSDASLALPVLKRALANSESSEQLQIAEAVARINPRDADAVTVLIGGLRDPDSGVRFQAAYALSEVSPVHAERVFPELAAAMGDQSPQVRQAAELALAKFPPPRVPEPQQAITRVAVVSEPVPTGEPAVVVEEPAVVVVEPVIEAQPIGRSRVVVLLDPEPVATVQAVARQLGETQFVATAEGTLLAVDPKVNRLGLGEDYKPITSVNVSITPKRRDIDGKLLSLPTNYGAGWLQTQGTRLHPIGESRPGEVKPVQYAASGFCHRPLYFEEINLERYGHNFGCVMQPFVSAAAFYGRVPLMPYMMAAEPACECQYTLGHYRPGTCAPYQPSRLPCSLPGTLLEAGVITGLCLAIY